MTPEHWDCGYEWIDPDTAPDAEKLPNGWWGYVSVVQHAIYGSCSEEDGQWWGYRNNRIGEFGQPGEVGPYNNRDGIMRAMETAYKAHSK